MIALSPHAPSVLRVNLAAVQEGCGVPENERSDRDVCDDDVVVDAEVLGTEELGGGGDRDGSDGSGAQADDGRAYVEGEGGFVEE